MKLQSLLLATVLSLLSTSVFAETVNINKADASAFRYYLFGIGEKRAINIMFYRQANKEFKSIAEIMEVKGIGRGIFAKIKTDLSLTEGAVSAPNKKTIETPTVKKETITETVIDTTVQENNEMNERKESRKKVILEVSETDNKAQSKDTIDSTKNETADIEAEVLPPLKKSVP
jgi:competence protein ComEA